MTEGKSRECIWWLDGKVALVTGSTSGLGLETCRSLLNNGCRVLMACRDMEKGAKCKTDITEGDQMKASMCDLIKLDLASLQSIRDCAENIISTYQQVHILVNNAGVICKDRTLSADGIELTIAVNHLGHFYLTRLLLPLLVQSQPSRIINVSSEAHRISQLKLDDLQMEHRWYSLVAYGRSKSANILFTVYLAQLLKFTQVTTYSVHPGVVDTHLGDNIKATCFMSAFKCCSALCCKRLLTPEEGAMSIVYLCQEPDLCFSNGLYFRKGRIRRAKGDSTNIKRAGALWLLSSELCDMSPDPDELGSDMMTRLRKNMKSALIRKAHHGAQRPDGPYKIIQR